MLRMAVWTINCYMIRTVFAVLLCLRCCWLRWCIWHLETAFFVCIFLLILLDRSPVFRFNTMIDARECMWHFENVTIPLHRKIFWFFFSSSSIISRCSLACLNWMANWFRLLENRSGVGMRADFTMLFESINFHRIAQNLQRSKNWPI